MKHGKIISKCNLPISKEERKSLELYLIPKLLKVLGTDSNHSTSDCYELYERDKIEKIEGMGDSYNILINLNEKRAYRNKKKTRVWLNGIICQVHKCEYFGGIVQYDVSVWLNGYFCEYRKRNKRRLFEYRHYYDFDTEIENLITYNDMDSLFEEMIR